jgi:hypothetical protein
MLAIFRSGHKILCDGHVMNSVYLNNSILIFSNILCDGHVIDKHKSYLIGF